jgi:predicted secreted protein
MKRILVICSVIFLSVTHLFGGDTARFVNLGFSGNGAYFMFAQHGYQAQTGKAYSDLYVVDVYKNVFTTGGVLHGEFETIIEPGQSSDGALYTILEKSIAQRERYGISYIQKGRPLYIRIAESGEDENSNSLQFRDFETETKYTIDLKQTTVGESREVKSSFYIDLKLEYKNGIIKELKIGHPDFQRMGITEYTINRILLSPGEEALVFIISKTDVDLNVRYMIETVKIK